MDVPTAHATLGVDASTPLSEVRSRYRLRAQMLHPDRLGDRPELQREAQRAMAELTEAWSVVETADRSGSRWQSSTPNARSASDVTNAERLPYEGECDFCGVQPAARIPLRAVTGMLILHRLATSHLDLCSRCARNLFREVQTRTLVRGWWGLTAMFATVGVLVANAWHIGRHTRRLKGPVYRDPAVVTPMPPGLPLVLPVMGRLRSWVAPLAFMGVFATVAALGQPATGGDPIDYDPGVPSTAIGVCLDLDGLEVDCFGLDAAYIIDQIATYPSDCGYLTPFEDDYGTVFCASRR